MTYIFFVFFVFGFFFVSISYISYYNNMSILIFQIPLEDFSMFLIMISLIVGLILLVTSDILRSIYENKSWEVKYPLFEDEIKPKYNIKDRLFIELESKITFINNQPRKINYRSFLFYFLILFILLFALSEMIARMLIKNQSGLLALTIILQIINFSFLLISFICYFFDAERILKKIFRKNSLVNLIIEINNITLMPQIGIYGVSLGSTFAILSKNSSLTIVNGYFSSLLYCFWSIFTFILLFIIGLIRIGVNNKIKSKILDIDYLYTRELFTTYRDFSSMLNKEMNKEILYEILTENLLNATLSNKLSRRYAVVLSKGLFNSILDYCDDPNNHEILNSYLIEPNTEVNNTNDNIKKIFMTSFVYYTKGKKAYIDNDIKVASDYFNKAILTWEKLNYEKIRDFNIHFHIAKDFCEMVSKEPVEKTQLYQQIAIKYIQICDSTWHFDYWAMILSSIYAIYYLVRLSRKGNLLEDIQGAKEILEDLKELKEIEEYNELYSIPEAFITSVEKYSESYLDDKIHIAESDRLKEYAQKYLTEIENKIDRVNLALRETYTTSDTYKEILTSISQNQEVEGTNKKKPLPFYYRIISRFSGIVFIGLGTNIVAAFLFEYVSFFKSNLFLIIYSVCLVIGIIADFVFVHFYRKRN